MKKKLLPQFKNSEEEAKFWDTHDFTEYLDQLKEVDDIFVLAPTLAKRIKERSKKRMISIRLADWEIEKSKEIARKKGTHYQALMRQWIDAGLQKEFLVMVK